MAGEDLCRHPGRVRYLWAGTRRARDYHLLGDETIRRRGCRKRTRLTMTDSEVATSAFGPRSPRFPSSKFSTPRSGSRLVHRARLFDELARGERARLTLVVGSPGAGKTALLADWVASVAAAPICVAQL